MVGVPGRSKACVTCLKRKKRCDLEKPICGTCRKACIECGGYFRPRIFVNNTVQNQDSKWTTPAAAIKEIRRDNANFNANKSIQLNTAGSDRRRRDERKKDEEEEESVALSPALARSAYQTKYLDLFWNMYLPNGQALSPTVTENVVGGWINTLQDLLSTDEVLRKATLAISLTSIGKYNADRAVEEEGIKLYANSLQNMAVALRSRRKSTEDGLLAVIRVFSLYESMYGSDERTPAEQARSWVVHNVGDAALIVTRTPYAFITGHAHALFVDGRAHLTLSALATRKRTFLSEPAWKTIPWTQHKKSPRDHLIDILIDITTLFEGMDIMKAMGDVEKRELARHRLIIVCLQLKQRLLQWRSDYSPDFEPSDSLPAVISAQDLAAAYLMCFYWTTSIVVCSNLDSLARPGETVDWDIDTDLFCRMILKTVPLFFHSAMGLYRVHLATYPLRVVSAYIAADLGRLTTERQMLAKCLESPAAAGIRRFIASNIVEFADILQ